MEKKIKVVSFLLAIVMLISGCGSDEVDYEALYKEQSQSVIELNQSLQELKNEIQILKSAPQNIDNSESINIELEKDRYSSKWINIKQLDIIRTALKEPEKQFLCFLTGFGLVTGQISIVSKDKKSDIHERIKQVLTENENILNLVTDLKTYYIDSIENIELIGDGSSVILENVTIFKDSQNVLMRADTFLLHCEDVMGFCLIEKSLIP